MTAKEPEGHSSIQSQNSPVYLQTANEHDDSCFKKDIYLKKSDFTIIKEFSRQIVKGM